MIAREGSHGLIDVLGRGSTLVRTPLLGGVSVETRAPVRG